MGSAPRALVQGPDRQPIPFGLFSVLTFRTSAADGRWENGIQWERGTPSAASAFGDWDSTSTPGYPKSLDPTWDRDEVSEIATPFTVYGHWRGSPVGWDADAASAEARRHLLTREEAAAANILWTGAQGVVPNLQGTGAADDPTLVTPLTDTPVGVLAELEQWIADSYGSLGVLHMGRRLATYLVEADLLTVRGATLQTVLGTPVVASAGYPGTGPANVSDGSEDLTTWVYATAPLFGYRSEVYEPTDGRDDLFDRGTNTRTAVAERAYVIAFDTSVGLAAAPVVFA